MKKIKAMLRLNHGIITKAQNLPDYALEEWKVPIQPTASVKAMIELGSSDFMQIKDGVKVLIFVWDGESIWGNNKCKNPVYILDLVDMIIM